MREGLKALKEQYDLSYMFKGLQKKSPVRTSDKNSTLRQNQISPLNRKNVYKDTSVMTDLGIPRPKVTPFMDQTRRANEYNNLFPNWKQKPERLDPKPERLDPTTYNDMASFMHITKQMKDMEAYATNNPKSLGSGAFKGRIDKNFISSNLNDLPFDSDISRDLTLRSAGRRGSF
jgi:hypothetical protein